MIKTALIFDDNKEVRSLMRDIVAQFGYESIAFSSPTLFLSKRQESCCHAVDNPCVNLIITDNQMPEMSGLEFLERIKSNKCKLPDRKKAILSGTWSNEELDRAKNLGCKIFSKPLQIEDFEEWLGGIDSPSTGQPFPL